MRYRITTANEPKTKKAALQVAATIETMKSQNQIRKENLMISKAQAQEKLASLQRTIEGLENLIKEAEEADQLNNEFLEELKLKWQLTEAEILEIQSASLRERLKELEKQKLLKKAEDKLI